MAIDYVIFTDGSSKRTTDGDIFTAYGCIVLNMATKTFMEFSGDLGCRSIRYAESYAIYCGVARVADIAKETTNAISALIITDSRLDVQILTEYIPKWDTSGDVWYKLNGEPVKNQDVYKDIIRISNSVPNVSFSIIHINSHRNKDTEWWGMAHLFKKNGVNVDQETMMTIIDLNSRVDSLARSKMLGMIKEHKKYPDIVRLTRKTTDR